jgi:hypothetical protein
MLVACTSAPSGRSGLVHIVFGMVLNTVFMASGETVWYQSGILNINYPPYFGNSDPGVSVMERLPSLVATRLGPETALIAAAGDFNTLEEG